VGELADELSDAGVVGEELEGLYPCFNIIRKFRA